MPLAMILNQQGAKVAGSDRSLDQGRLAEKFAFLRRQGIDIFPQDGSGIRDSETILVCSTAVEDQIPDVQAAKRLGSTRITRAQLLASLFNAAPHAIGIAGTSGKSTTTGMIGWMLHKMALNPTIINGAVMKNFVTPDVPFASAVVGSPNLLVAEVDESDGSIADYTADIAVLNNLALDHKGIEDLRALFGGFIGRARRSVVNFDNEETRDLAALLPPSSCVTYGLNNPKATLFATDLVPEPEGISFRLHTATANLPVQLQIPGEHNVANALACLGVAVTLGLDLSLVADSLSLFTGMRRRMERVGTQNGITVLDDFAHNPDKIAATLTALHTFPGRLIVMFQPHGYGPLRLFRKELVACFATQLAPDDLLLMPEPLYVGGTVDRSLGSGDIVAEIQAAGHTAEAFPDRCSCRAALLSYARTGDRIVIMGARDDTLSLFAQEILSALPL